MSEIKHKNNNLQDADAFNESDPIVPIDFTPANLEQRRFNFKLSPARSIIGLFLLCCFAVAWFVLTAKSIFIDVNPLVSEVSVNKPLAIKIGPRYLVREGQVPISIHSEGYYDLDTSLTISEAQAQTFVIDLIRLPGFLNLDTQNVNEVSIFIDGEAIGLTPATRIELAAGEHTLLLEKDRYQSVQTIIEIEGRTTEQDLQIEILPAWANVSFNTLPNGATITVDGENIGLTPLNAEILEGEHEIIFKLNAHKAVTQVLDVIAQTDIALPLLELIEADGLVMLQSRPSNASVTLDGAYQGQTPLEVSMTPGTNHQLVFFLNGYEELQRTIQSRPDDETSLSITLAPILSSVSITAQPANAELYVNGEFIGNANQTIELLAASQLLEVRHVGFVTFETQFTSRPGLEQNLKVNLISLEQQRINSIKPIITSVGGQTLKLLYPSSFVMGASRREAGRQANETLRNITLNKPFYLSLTEVTNAEFALFNTEHNSGVVAGRTLSNASQPVVRVSWEAAAQYANWLSEQESLPFFYEIEGGLVVGINPESTGYRLPTEAEWAWAARVDGSASSLLKFPWGPQLPPPENHGNYADISAAAILGRIIVNYNDSFTSTAPVASFDPNGNGFYDMGGNVAEWTHDYYGASGQLGGSEEINPTGPSNGRYHVVRGSGWAHGTVTELRLSFRDYSDEPRDDLGFRIARTLEQ